MTLLTLVSTMIWTLLGLAFLMAAYLDYCRKLEIERDNAITEAQHEHEANRVIQMQDIFYQVAAN